MKQHTNSLYNELKIININKELVKQSIKRDFFSRYQGSLFGVIWAFLMPLFLLAVYTFVFSVIFKAKWGVGEGQSKLDFALILFIGMIIYNFFAEVLTRSPGVIIGNVNFVKKVVYPLETIPLMVVGTAFLNMVISFIVWELAFLFIKQSINYTFIYIPILIIPLVFMMLGLSLFLSSLGTYIRDISQIAGVLVTVFMFLSPIFFSIDTVPHQFRIFMQINPLTFFIEEARNILFFEQKPDFTYLLIYYPISIVALKLGFIFFQKTRSGFSDVI
ncbi:sugar ABC transporter permease [Photobacterium damselae]|uniref:Sugar ABC transporter permease n=2 Tax=Photobacterium damselae TaxID=38293 RepID=A0ACD3SU91_PHODM|nr:ABC transporter permease [Photobacterium damselae]NVO99673.1 ABC transporter permease [Photobacterium damselae subsp. damselae]RDL31304.1 sugar ABC transporter permease [Photobacterium damselae]TMX50434.1 sugar ABC transporter permease [Photobacterium damselae]TMX70306.1 sugar ABC transporter permease [Photobacterium damselae]